MVADALSRLPLLDTEDPPFVRQAEERFEDAYLFYPVQNYMEETYPFNFAAIAQAQVEDAQLTAMLLSRPESNKKINVGSYELIHHKVPASTSPRRQEIWKLVLPVSKVNLILSWFHRVLHHPGATRMYFTIAQKFYFPNMKQLKLLIM